MVSELYKPSPRTRHRNEIVSGVVSVAVADTKHDRPFCIPSMQSTIMQELNAEAALWMSNHNLDQNNESHRNEALAEAAFTIAFGVSPIDQPELYNDLIRFARSRRNMAQQLLTGLRPPVDPAVAERSHEHRLYNINNRNA